MLKWIGLMFVPMVALAEVPQGPANADFEPAFENQTRAPQLPETDLKVSEFAQPLNRPWGITALPTGQFLVTERPGRLVLVEQDGTIAGEVSGLPAVAAQDQGGLLDVAVSPTFASDRLVFWSYAKNVDGGVVTAAAKGELNAEGRLENVQDIFLQMPPSQSYKHFGSRVIPMSDGTVWITTGEHSTPQDRVKAQDNQTTYGKVIRLNWDGSAPSDNPFVGAEGIDSIWSYGHRNIQGAAMGPGGLWTIEHGPRGGDELNRPEAGKNYGWPVISYGINYNGSSVGSGEAVREGMEQPVYYWDPVIAPGGMAFYDGPFDKWQGDILASSLNPGGLVRLKLEDGRVVGEERMLEGVGRVRDVEVLDDGAILVLIDNPNGVILRVEPQG